MLNKTLSAIVAIVALVSLALIAAGVAFSQEEEMFARRVEYRAAFAELKRSNPALFEPTPCLRSPVDFERCLKAYAAEHHLPATQSYMSIYMLGHLLLTASVILLLLCAIPAYHWWKALEKHLKEVRRARWRTVGHANIVHPPR